MEGFMHWYNLHRKTIWTIIGVAVLIFIMINVINSSLKQKEQPSNTASTNTIKMNSISMDSDKSPITGDQITNDQKNTVTVIDNLQHIVTMEILNLLIICYRVIAKSRCIKLRKTLKQFIMNQYLVKQKEKLQWKIGSEIFTK